MKHYTLGQVIDNLGFDQVAVKVKGNPHSPLIWGRDSVLHTV